MNTSPTTIDVQIITTAVTNSLHQVNQNLLLFECLRYNKLSAGCKAGATGRAIYKRMKALNEKVLLLS